MTDPGHNSNAIAAEQLQSFVRRIERLEEEKAELASDIKEVYAEAKSNGFDAKIIRILVRERKQDAAERREREAVLELYRQALGDLDGTPLGEAALRRAGE